MTLFWKYIARYTTISPEAKAEWSLLLRVEEVTKGDYFLKEGIVPKKIAFVTKGLLSYDYLDTEGKKVTKKFFAENSLVTSTSALIQQQPGIFSIQALEDTTLLTYSAEGFKSLLKNYKDVSAFYIAYLERHWVVEKEQGEIRLKSDTAKQRYLAFEKAYPELLTRLKLHHIASYLAVTPTQLSRIRAER